MVEKFDVEKARQLLKQAGWKANPKTGLLEKDGKLLKKTPPGYLPFGEMA